MVANSPQGIPQPNSPTQVMVPVVAASGPPAPNNQTMPVSPMAGEPIGAVGGPNMQQPAQQ